MKKDLKNRWWRIFTKKRYASVDGGCPPVPVKSGRAWQRSLANLYCPCKNDPTAVECRPLFV